MEICTKYRVKICATLHLDKSRWPALGAGPPLYHIRGMLSIGKMYKKRGFLIPFFVHIAETDLTVKIFTNVAVTANAIIFSFTSTANTLCHTEAISFLDCNLEAVDAIHTGLCKRFLGSVKVFLYHPIGWHGVPAVNCIRDINFIHFHLISSPPHLVPSWFNRTNLKFTPNNITICFEWTGFTAVR